MISQFNGSFYPEMTTFDLRKEFSDLLLGTFEEPGIGRPVIYRKLSNTTCACFDKLNGSPDPNCTYCQGEGYLFTETMETVYIAKNFGSVLGGATQIGQQTQLADAGYMDSNRCLIYMFWYSIKDYERYLIPSTKAPDKIYELKPQDAGGDPVLPLIRLDKWAIRSCTPHNGDHGRVEYIELGMEKVDI